MLMSQSTFISLLFLQIVWLILFLRRSTISPLRRSGSMVFRLFVAHFLAGRLPRFLRAYANGTNVIAAINKLAAFEVGRASGKAPVYGEPVSTMKQTRRI